MRRPLLLLLILIACPLLPACNTMHGLGQDIQAAGEALQDAAD